MSKIPGLARRSSNLVIHQDTMKLQDFDGVTSDVRALRSSVIAWRRDYNTAMIHDANRGRTHERGTGVKVFDKRYEMLGMSLVVHILASRMLVCIAPTSRALLEEEVQSLALELKSLQESLEDDGRATFFLAQKAKIADAAIATHIYFLEAAESGRIIEPWRMKKYCEAIGRKYEED